MSLKLIDKDIDHLALELKLYKLWMKNNLFRSSPSKKSQKFSIMMPPPNVTGTLHIGHALNMTVQDIIARFWRMNKKDVLWQPGTDHAGIATQKIVENKLKEQDKLNKKDIGKQEFLKKVWAWKEESGDKIINQIKRLGASPDWGRMRFTLDKEMSSAVNFTFIELFNKGLIYKDKRLVNWDISLQTAVSDLEVEQIDKEGEFVYLKYYLEDKSGFLEVATTRPETLFGDQCLAVNPKDKRYTKFIGKKVILPLTNELIPIISDDYVDMEKGSGVLKITPAHDFNDYKIGKTHNLKLKVIFDKYGKFNRNVPEKYQGLDRIKTRKIIINDLKENGNFMKIEKLKHTVPYGDRSGTIIEPYLTDQWFMNVKPLADEVVKLVEEGNTKFYPSSWVKTFYLWMNEIEPWCISRQIWWGHRIPIWYGPDGNAFAAKNEEEANKISYKFYNEKKPLTQETDVLDTWFSSALWPMSTLGWPDSENIYFKNYFPTNVLVTGFDIIFFWVARMMMQAAFFTKQVPFKEVYIHALVRDKDGNKMSKSKGNVIDPLQIIDKFGADSLRFTLSLMAVQGRDIKLSEDNVKINRNFITKIRNAFNFLQKNKCFEVDFQNISNLNYDENIWILKLLNKFILSIEKNIKNYKFNDASKDIYKFVKNFYCDWYLEFIKISLKNSSEFKNINEIKACASIVFKNILKLAHPFIPFMTDDIYVNYLKNEKFLMQESWPVSISFNFEQESYNNIETIIKVTTLLRNIKANLKIEPKNLVKFFYTTQNNKKINMNEEYIKSLAKVNLFNVDDNELKSEEFMKFVDEDFTFYIEKNKIDSISSFKKDLNILNEQLFKLEQDIKILKNKIDNKEFIDKAPKLVVDKFKTRMNEKISLKNKILKEIKSL